MKKKIYAQRYMLQNNLYKQKCKLPESLIGME